jgi:hypothetical protein
VSSTTTNLTLVKAAGSEAYSASVVNTNLDLVDAALGSTAVGAAGAAAAMLRDVGITTSYTGSTAKNTLDLEPTWNTSGTMRGLYIAVTHTAAGGSSRAIEVRRGANTIFDVDITTATAVNGVGVLGSATGVGATLQTLGADTNIDLLLVAKGSGVVKADGVEVVTLTGTQTLTNKTLTTPTVASLTNMQHTHADAAGGGQLDWDTAWSDAVHTHASAGEGGTSLTGLTAVTLASGQLTLPVGSAASPSLVFDSGNGVYSAGTDRLNFATAGVVRAEIDAAGNMGVGATPSAWVTTQRALHIGQAGSIVAPTAATGMTLRDNTYNDGSDRAISAEAASQLQLTGGSLLVYTAPSVAAGAVQTFTSRLTVNLNGDIVPTINLNSNATGGFVFISGAGGAPTGVPTNYSQSYPLYYDQTNNRLYIYNHAVGAWRYKSVDNT